MFFPQKITQIKVNKQCVAVLLIQYCMFVIDNVHSIYIRSHGKGRMHVKMSALEDSLFTW